MRTYYVSFAGNSVAIDYAGKDQRDLLDYLFGDLDKRGTDEPLSRMRLSRAGASGSIRLEQDGSRIYSGNNRAALARTLVEKALYTLVDRDHSGLAIHAAAVSAGPTGVLIPGQSGAGKSTLAAWLASRGYGYLTDELVHIPLDTNTIEAFTRPVNLKRNGCGIPEGELGITGEDHRVLSNKQVYIVPHRLFNPSHEKLEPEISVILFPRLVSTPDHRLEPLTKGQAALKLVECLVNGRNITHHGMDQISRIIREIPTFTLHYSGFETLSDLVSGILPRPGSPDAPGQRLPRDAV